MSEPLKSNQRMWDLLRYQRSDLLLAKLITFDEFDALAQDHPAVKRLEDYDALKAEVAALNRKLEETVSIWKNQISALTAECDGLKRELEVAQAACAVKNSTLEKYGQHKDGCLWATELPTGNGQFWGCDCGLDAAINEPNPGAPLIAELTKLREVVKAGDHVESLMRQILDSIENPDRMSGVLVGKAEESISAYLAAKSALEVKG